MYVRWRRADPLPLALPVSRGFGRVQHVDESGGGDKFGLEQRVNDDVSWDAAGRWVRRWSRLTGRCRCRRRWLVKHWRSQQNLRLFLRPLRHHHDAGLCALPARVQWEYAVPVE